MLSGRADLSAIAGLSCSNNCAFGSSQLSKLFVLNCFVITRDAYENVVVC